MAETLPEVLADYDEPRNWYRDPAARPPANTGREPFPNADLPPPPDNRPSLRNPDLSAYKNSDFPPFESMADAAKATAWGLAGAHVPVVGGMFFNTRAKGADMAKYARARQMLEQGVPREQVLRETGYHESPGDKEMLWETSDKDFMENINPTTNRGLGPNSPIPHPDIAANVPGGGRELRSDLQMSEIPYSPRGTVGGYMLPRTLPSGRTMSPKIEMLKDLPPGAEAPNFGGKRGTILHELMHFVQNKLGIPTPVPGSQINDFFSPEMVGAMIHNGEQPAMFDTPYGQMPAPFRGSHVSNALLHSVNNVLLPALERGLRERGQPVDEFRRARDLDDVAPVLTNVNRFLGINGPDGQPAPFTNQQLKFLARQVFYRIYQLQEGEAYPRLVQFRRDMPQHELAQKAPWEMFDVPERDIIPRRHLDHPALLMVNGPGLPEILPQQGPGNQPGPGSTGFAPDSPFGPTGRPPGDRPR